MFSDVQAVFKVVVDHVPEVVGDFVRRKLVFSFSWLDDVSDSSAFSKRIDEVSGFVATPGFAKGWIRLSPAVVG